MRLINYIVIICWVIFWIYWFISAINSKKNDYLGVKRNVGVRLLIIVLAIILIHYVDRSTFNHYSAAHNFVLESFGLVVFLAGLALAVWARIYLGKNWGMPMTLKKDPELVTDGPYKYIRHPIYTGIILAVIGSAAASSTYWLVLLLISGPYFIYSALVEEKTMNKLFPKTYPNYKARTKMLIPFIF